MALPKHHASLVPARQWISATRHAPDQDLRNGRETTTGNTTGKPGTQEISWFTFRSWNMAIDIETWSFIAGTIYLEWRFIFGERSWFFLPASNQTWQLKTTPLDRWSIYRGFPIPMFDYRRVLSYIWGWWWYMIIVYILYIYIYCIPNGVINR